MRIDGKHRTYTLKTEADLLKAAYESTPWILRALRISLPAFLVRQDLREQYQDFKSKLERRARIWPFHFNQGTLAMRKGFLVVTDGQPDRVWITEMS
jgi:hypothetical protein